MMNILLQAATLADTLAGGNPVLTPLASGEPQMNLWDMADRKSTRLNSSHSV